jgi:beta-lactam-binding protein with PASTA domain
LVGKSLDAATAQLQGLGFVVDTQSYLPGRVVRATDPAAGTQVPKGTKVTLFFRSALLIPAGGPGHGA